MRSFIEEPVYLLETEIIDTGIGISPNRQKMLFVPFMELMLRQNFDTVQDNTIGVGLASSQIITQQMKGDIKLKQSQPQLTVFTFTLPVSVEPIMKNEIYDPIMIKDWFEQSKVQHPKVREYLSLTKGSSNYFIRQLDTVIPTIED